MEEYFKYLALRNEQVKDLVEELGTSGLLKKVQAGDPVAIQVAEASRISLKGNYRRLFGDCSRLISQVRNYNPFSPAQAKQAPISSSEVVGNVAPDGQRATPNPKTNISSAVPKSAGKASALENGEYTTYMKISGIGVYDWTAQEFYQNILIELAHQQINWDTVEQYIAGYFIKAGRKMIGSYKVLKQSLQTYIGRDGHDEEGISNILAVYGITASGTLTEDATAVPQQSNKESDPDASLVVKDKNYYELMYGDKTALYPNL